MIQERQKCICNLATNIEFHRLAISTYQGKTFYFSGFRGKKKKAFETFFPLFLDEGKFSQKKNVLKQSLMLISFEPEAPRSIVRDGNFQRRVHTLPFFVLFFLKILLRLFFFFKKKTAKTFFFYKDPKNRIKTLQVEKRRRRYRERD